MKIEILGSGCMKCNKLYELTKRIVEENGIDADVVKVEDINRMVELGLWATPGLAVNGKILSAGRLPSPDDLKDILREAGRQ
ncbi:MAG TPA: thioredoxin family protein [Thermoanaerobaculia bacterium]|nr:thioredoxin family protein [Thermoanaerobaculia bacterium]HUM30913.1 thioredoxin family protein [Thermoanaerobaculia bacterium]HXK69246.1 thioredoxin family protein [Thermoanaerobaculia bacterium]